MGLFSGKKEEESTKIKEMQEEERFTCDDCNGEFIIAQMADENHCKECIIEKEERAKKQKEKAEKFGHELIISYFDDDSGNSIDDKSFNRISKADAEKLFASIKEALYADKKYAECGRMNTMNADDEEGVYFPEIFSIKNVTSVIVGEMEED